MARALQLASEAVDDRLNGRQEECERKTKEALDLLKADEIEN